MRQKKSGKNEQLAKEQLVLGKTQQFVLKKTEYSKCQRNLK